MIFEGMLVHDGSKQLSEHVQRAVAVKAESSIALSSARSPGEISLARCMVWTAAMASRPTVVGKPIATVITSSPGFRAFSPNLMLVNPLKAAKFAEDPEFTITQYFLLLTLANVFSSNLTFFPYESLSPDLTKLIIEVVSFESNVFSDKL
jgi:hypothetical protein